MSMIYCSNCGNQMSDLAQSCPNCGHPNQTMAIATAPGLGKRDPATGRILAGWWQRVGAALIDGIIIAVPAWILMFILGVGFLASRRLRIDPVTGEIVGRSAVFGGIAAGIFVSFAIVFGLTILYRVLMDGSPRGQTLGKMALKIQVRDAANGTAPIGYGRAFVRYLVSTLLGFVAVIPFLFIVPLLDVLFPLWDSRSQTIHDKAANSIVVLVQ